MLCGNLPLLNCGGRYLAHTKKIFDYIDDRLEKVKPATVYQEFALMRRMVNVARRDIVAEMEQH